MPLFIAALYLLSGFAGLAYEVLWARQLGLVFGVSNFGIVITVSAFMAGLGGGSLIASKVAFFVKKPLLLFALLELLLGLFAFNLPSILSASDAWVTETAAGSSLAFWFSLQGLILFLLFCIPALVMGMGFPLVLSACKRLNISLAAIYGINTLGGVLGCIFPLLMLPLVGWTVSVRLVALVSIFIAIVCAVLAWFVRHDQLAPSSSPDKTIPKMPIAMYALIGAMALVMQICWSRMYGMILLRTEYVVALLIASFLIGIALGSFLSRWMKGDIWKAVLPIFVAIGVLASLSSLPWVAAWAESAEFAGIWEASLRQGLILLLITLPATVAFGAWLPVLAVRTGEEHHSGALYYAANSLGAALGAIVAGFILMPLLGTPASLVLAMIVVLLVATYWVKTRWYFATAGLLSIAAMFFVVWPSVSVLLPSAQAKSADLSVQENALAVTHVIQNTQGHRFLLSDLQRMDASTEPTAITVQRIQGSLPLLLAPSAEQVLFLGLGTGISAAGALPFVNSNISAVELSKAAIDAAGNEFEFANDGVVKKIDVINDDARRFIKTTDKKFDVIVGDLFHPDLVGRSALLSRQQFERVRSRLNDNGVFVQWIALNQFDVESLKIILHTFKQAFPRAEIFADGFRLALVGTNRGVKASTIIAKADMNDERVFANEDAWSWLGRYWGTIPDFDVATQDEWAPVIEFRIPEARYSKSIDLRKTLGFLLQIRPNLAVAGESLELVELADIDRFSRAYQATSMIYASWFAKLSGDEEEATSFLEQAYRANPIDRWISFEMADRMFASLDQAVQQGLSKSQALMRIVEMRPDHVDALKMLWRLEMASGAFDNADDIKARLLELNPHDPELAKK
ncbi:MAG: fused MFS/spermidine synthase [Gammaproteobacteria bacterium]|nr:fused MFS/spermidine synthase [Gammaproteobacteria bacterium]